MVGLTAVPCRARVSVALLLCAFACACGGSRTNLPTPKPTGQGANTSVETTPPTDAEGSTSGPTATGASPTTDVSGRTLSPWISAGLKHGIPGGTLAASYPRVQTRPPAEAPKLPPGQAYWFITAKYCAEGAPIPGNLVDPARFQVEVPGQGYVGWKPENPVVFGQGLVAGGDVVPGTCREGTISFVIAGELHVESITFDSGPTILRWAS